jgi:hypothetical protein
MPSEGVLYCTRSRARESDAPDLRVVTALSRTLFLSVRPTRLVLVLTGRFASSCTVYKHKTRRSAGERTPTILWSLVDDACHNGVADGAHAIIPGRYLAGSGLRDSLPPCKTRAYVEEM